MLRPVRSFLPPAALAMLLALFACSESDPADPLATAAGTCARVRADMVRVLMQCYGFSAGLANDAVAGINAVDCGAWAAAMDAGNATYDANKGRACLAVLDAVTCNQYAWADRPGRSPFPYECSEALAGALETSTSCVLGFECQSGVCEFPPACDAPGTCATAPGETESCAVTGAPCAGGLVCDAGTCVRPPPIPAPVAVGEDCTDAPCVDAAFCSAVDSKCIARPAENMSCSAANPCVYGYRCVGPLGSQTCQRIRAAGEPCSFGDTYCELGAYCATPSASTASGTCAPSGAGGACGRIQGVNSGGQLDVELVLCTGSWCDVPHRFTVGTCEPYLASGAVCTAANECGPATGCLDDGTGTSTLRCTKLYCSP